VWRTHAREGRRAGEGELEEAAGLEKARGGWGWRASGCGKRKMSLSFFSRNYETLKVEQSRTIGPDGCVGPRTGESRWICLDGHPHQIISVFKKHKL
jgi:hypothetical protein